jgi:thiol-disulfide isomerase/thioredoxin
MKKLSIVGTTVLVLVVAVIILNREIPPVNGSGPEAAAGSDATDQATPLVSMEDVVLKDLDGKPVKVADLKGKVVLLDFWATWCEPCKIETSWLIDYQQKYGPRGFTVVGVDIDQENKDVETIQHYIANAKFDVEGQKELINYPVMTGDESLGDRVGLDGYPTGVLISRDGHTVAIHSGLPRGGKAVLAREIETQLGPAAQQ